MTRRQETSLRATAYHEAGHAVMAVRLGIRFRFVTVAPRGDALGHVLSDWSAVKPPEHMETPQARDRLYRRAVSILAGPAAESKFLGRSVYHHVGARGDRDNLIELAESAGLASSPKASDDELLAWAKWMRLHTERLVSSHVNWPRIQAVADALLARDTLNLEQVRQIGDEGFQRAVAAHSSRTPPAK